MSLFLNPWRPSIAIWPPSIVFRSNEFPVLRIAGLTPVGVEAGPVNLTGTWDLQYMSNPKRGPVRPLKMTFVFKQEGEKLSGTFLGFGPIPEAKVIGAVKGNEVVLGLEMLAQWGTTEIIG